MGGGLVLVLHRRRVACTAAPPHPSVLLYPSPHICSDTLWEEYAMAKFIPFNPTDKYTVAFVKVGL